MEKKALVNYNVSEAAILSSIEESKLVPSRNEAWRRGLQSLSLLSETDEAVLFDLLAKAVLAAQSHVDDREKLSHHLREGKALANAIQATLISKKGLIGAEFMDAFTDTLREFSLLSDPEIYRRADKKTLEDELIGLRVLAQRYASKPIELPNR